MRIIPRYLYPVYTHHFTLFPLLGQVNFGKLGFLKQYRPFSLSDIIAVITFNRLWRTEKPLPPPQFLQAANHFSIIPAKTSSTPLS
jgi:hypothetical protein